MQNVFETYITKISVCAHEQDFSETLCAALRGFQIQSFAYVYFSSRRDADPFVLTNYPKEWRERYFNKAYFLIDPVVLKLRSIEQPFFWSGKSLLAHLQGPEDQLMAEAADCGIGRGLTFPIKDRFQTKAGVTFAAASDDAGFDETALTGKLALQLIATCFHVHARRLHSRNLVVSGVALTARELECLIWAARGKSTRDTADILGIKARTVTFHLDNVRRKFEVRTVNQAIAILSASRPDLAGF